MTSSASDGRARILGTIARSLGRGPLPAAEAAVLDQRLADHRPNTIPARAQLPQPQQVDLFVIKAGDALATVDRVGSNQDVPGAVARYLADEGLLPKLTIGPAAELAALPWSSQAGLGVNEGRVGAEGEAALTGVFAAVAETGTLMMTSGPETPTGNVFLPETHIALVHAEQVVGPLEDAWARLRAAGSTLPRTVNLVTGPSRTGDIEAVMYMGAHGPRRLHIIIVG
jgi:L-lactate dehydrogenase complex protein LldG